MEQKQSPVNTTLFELSNSLNEMKKPVSAIQVQCWK